MELVDPPPHIKALASHGLQTVLQDESLCDKVLRFDSVIDPKTIGFFIAKFKKLESTMP